MRLILGDCIEKLKDMDDDSVDAVITDPPYLTTDLRLDKRFSIDDFINIIKEIKRVLKLTGWFFCFLPVELVRYIADLGFRLKFEYIWIKSNITPKTHNTIRPYYKHEVIYAFIHQELKKVTELTFNKEKLRTPGKPYVKNRNRKKFSEYEKETRSVFKNNTTYEFKNNGYREGTTLLYAKPKSMMPLSERTTHPTQKPLSLINTIVEGYSNEGDTIVDPFMGSGTTGIACKKLNREFIGIEIDKEYYEIAKKRIADANVEEGESQLSLFGGNK